MASASAASGASKANFTPASTNENSRLNDQAKPKSKKTTVIVATIVAFLLAFGTKYGYDSLMETGFHNQFYYNRPDLLLMHSMPWWKKWFLLKTPFLEEFSKQVLQELGNKGHVSKMEMYNAEKHDTEYRMVKHNVVSQKECARIRSLLLRQDLGSEWLQGSEALIKEFGEASVYELLGIQNSERVQIHPEEQKLLSSVLWRVQAAAEEKFNSSSIFLDYSGITLRRNPYEKDSFWKRLHYYTTGGHGTHADQCGCYNNIEEFTNGFECVLTEEHCCAQRTHSVLLYLNDPEDGDLVGGDLYLVDRQDLIDPSKPSYSGVGLAEQFKHTLRVKPTCGTLVFFASDARNFHGTFPIQSGSRVAMPMWFTSAKDIPWHNPEVLREQMSEDGYWEWLKYRCDWMNGELPVPSGLEPYLDDCEAMVQAVKDEMGWERLGGT